MGQKTHPYGLRLGITEAHRSRWYAPKALYGELLVEDYKIRQFLDKRLNRTPPFAAVPDVHIERTREELKVIDDQVGAPTSARLIAEVTLRALERIDAGQPIPEGIYHLAAAGETTWNGYARFAVADAIAARTA